MDKFGDLVRVQPVFVEYDDGFDLKFGGQIILRHRVDHPVLQVARGNPNIDMYRGNFTISDDPVSFTPLSFAYISGQNVSLSSSEHGMAEATLTVECAPNGFKLQIISHNPECDRLTVDIHAVDSEYIWGGGEQMSYLNLRGRKFPIWTSEPGVGRDKSTKLTQIMDAEGKAGGDYWTTNYPQPTFISSSNYACHLDSSAYSVMDFTDMTRHQLHIWDGCAQVEFFFADNVAGLVGALSTRFGRQHPLPDWAIGGAIIGLKEGDKSFDRLEKIITAGAQVSGLWCEDWVGIRQTSFGRRLFWNWDWNAERYPGLPEKIAALNERGIRFLGYVNPYLAVDGAQFAEAKSRGFLALNQENDDPYLVDFGEFDCGIVDFTNPDAAHWFADHVIGREMLDFGLSGWMADFGEYLPVDLRLFDGSDPMHAHNIWPVLWAEVNAKAIESRGKTGDALFFMRAGFSGVQAHCPLLWAGDQCVDFSRHDGIGTVIMAALSSGLVGNAYSHSDVGGYTSLHGVVRTEELLMRWAELGAFTPVMRTHEGNRPDDNLQIDSNPKILAHFAAMTRVHATLAPYVRHLCGEAVDAGLPVQRPLFLHYSNDEACLSCHDQYLYGADLLVAPMIKEGAMEREVYLPDGESWIHIWSGEKYDSGRHVIGAPFGSPPVFAREGSGFFDLFANLKQVRGAVTS